MPPVGFEPAIPASERPKTYALDRSVTGIGNYCLVAPCNSQLDMNPLCNVGLGVYRYRTGEEGFGVGVELEWPVIMFWKINSHYCASLREAL
jgi:hypothetical protein